MQEKNITPNQSLPSQPADASAHKTPFKNQNPNHNHSTKKEALGPNTKR